MPPWRSNTTSNARASPSLTRCISSSSASSRNLERRAKRSDPSMPAILTSHGIVGPYGPSAPQRAARLTGVADVSAAEVVEFAQRLNEGGFERFELVGLGRVEPRLGRCRLI